MPIWSRTIRVYIGIYQAFCMGFSSIWHHIDCQWCCGYQPIYLCNKSRDISNFHHISIFFILNGNRFNLTLDLLIHLLLILYCLFNDRGHVCAYTCACIYIMTFESTLLHMMIHPAEPPTRLISHRTEFDAKLNSY